MKDVETGKGYEQVKSFFVSERHRTSYLVIHSYPLPLVATEEITEFDITYFRFGDDEKNRRYLVISKGDLNKSVKPFLRINSACPWGILGSVQCDCDWQFEEAKRIIAKEGTGLIIYAFDQLGKGLGLEIHSLINAEAHLLNPNIPLYEKDIWADPFVKFGGKLDYRDFRDIIDILDHYKIKNVRLLTNNPLKITEFRKFGVTVERVSLEMPAISYNTKEYIVKKEKGKHLLEITHLNNIKNNFE